MGDFNVETVQKVSAANPTVKVDKPPTDYILSCWFKDLFDGITSPEDNDPFSLLGANSAVAFLSAENGQNFHEIAFVVGKTTLQESVQGVFQNLIISGAEKIAPPIRQLPLETILISLGLVTAVAKAEHKDRKVTMLEKTSDVAITLATAAAVSAVAHVFFGSLAVGLIGKGVVSLAQGGMTAVLLEANPLRKISTEAQVSAAAPAA